MEQLNNKIKDIYNQEHTPLPDEFKWDEMKEGVFEKMENHEDEPASFFSFSNGLKFLTLAVFLIFTSTSIYFLANNLKKNQTNSLSKSNSSNPSKNKSTTLKSIEKESKIKSGDENKSTLKPNNLVSKNTPVYNSTLQNIETSKDLTNQKTLDNNKLAQPKTANISTKKPLELSVKNTLNLERTSEGSNKPKQNSHLIVNHTNTNQTAKPIDSQNDISQTAHKNEVNYSKSIIEKSSRTADTKKKEVHSIEPLIKKNTDLLKNQIIEKINPIVNIPIIEESSAKEQLASKAIKLHGGITYMKSPFEKTDEAQYNSEIGFVAYYLDASYNRTFVNGFYLSLGATYSRLKSKFELSDTIIHSYLVKNVETKRVTNVLTGKVIRTEQGDAEAFALSSRIVRHYNKFDSWSIPIVFGKQWSYKLFSFNVGIGSDVSVYNWSEGKTLRENVVITYSKLETEPYHNGIQVAALTETGIGMAINNHLEIITNFRFKKHLRNWSADNLVVKPNVFLLGTGLKFKF